LSRSERFSFSKASLLVVANCIGTGIFTTTGFLLAELNHPVAVFGVWCLAALYALLGVRCYQELHQLYPGSGGEYHFLNEGWHYLLGRFAGFISLVAGFSAPIAAASIGFALYLNHFYVLPISSTVLATGLIVLLTSLQIFASGSFFKVHHLFVIGKLLGLVLLVVISFIYSPWQGLPSAAVELSASKIAHSFFWCAYAFSGWNAVYYIASEVLQEKSQVHRASFWGTLGVAVLYLAINMALLFTGDISQLSGQPEVVATFLTQLFGLAASRWLSLFISFGLVSTTSALFITGPRVYARMAQDGALPKIFYSAPGQIPKASLLLQMSISLLIVWSLDFDKILHSTGFILSLCSALAVSVLLRRCKPSDPIFWAAIVFCAATLWLVIVGLNTNGSDI
jgi:amino acid transporter